MMDNYAAISYDQLRNDPNVVVIVHSHADEPIDYFGPYMYIFSEEYPGRSIDDACSELEKFLNGTHEESPGKYDWEKLGKVKGQVGYEVKNVGLDQFNVDFLCAFLDY